MDNKLVKAAVLGLLAGAGRLTIADTLYDAKHHAVAKGYGTTSKQEITWRDCDSNEKKTFPLNGYSIEKGNDCTIARIDKNTCKGQNMCKGKGGCKSSDKGCKGKNTCKGKGGCAANMAASPEQPAKPQKAPQ